MVETTEPYRYQVLESHGAIRLIELQPSVSTTDIVHCKLIQRTLKQIQEDIVISYIALSYVWGNPNDTTSILVDSCNLQITKTLDCALRHVRNAERAMYIWADGICINQHDNFEKAQQVLLMGEIYSIAHHTVICLGPGDSTSGNVLRRVQECFDNDEYSSIELDANLVPGLRKVLSNPWFFRIWVLQELVLSRDPRIQWGRARCTWRALCQIGSLLPRFTFMSENRDAMREPGRALMEDTVSISALRPQYEYDIIPNSKKLETPQHQASTSSNVQTLGISKPQESSKSSVHILEFPQHSILERMQAAKDAHDHDILEDNDNRRRELRGSRLLSSDGLRRRDLKRLFEIMASRAGLGVSDPRDMVYAHLGLTKHARIQVDYTKTIANVYHDLVLEAICAFGNLRILGYVHDHSLNQRGTVTFSKYGVPASAEENLASWAPNWTLSYTRASYSIMEHVGYSFDSPGGSFKCGVMSRPPLLCIKGWVIGTLSEVGPVLENIETLREDDTRQHTLSELLNFGNPSPDWLMEIPGLSQKVVHLMWERHIAGHRPLLDHISPDQAREVIGHLCRRRFITSERSIVDGRRLAILDGDSKRFALVPTCAETGDHVYFLDTSPVPFVVRETDALDQSINKRILRRVNAEKDGYAAHRKPVKLVGECFADDAMYGK